MSGCVASSLLSDYKSIIKGANKEDIKGIANTNYHCLGGLIAEFDKDLGYYLIRNLVFDGKYIFDLNQRYGVKGTPKPVTAAAMTLGDLHFPEEDPFAVTKSIQQINLCKPEYTFLHDICSFNSINPHEANRAVDKVKSITNDNITLDNGSLYVKLPNGKYELVNELPSDYRESCVIYIKINNINNFV